MLSSSQRNFHGLDGLACDEKKKIHDIEMDAATKKTELPGGVAPRQRQTISFDGREVREHLARSTGTRRKKQRSK